ncbi:hypothetical protein [Kibdelosporangium aridum]|uniref:hypothetical protein n=1 Tax=Kibdelosporangium aridum TaxID=2030 RepID=UPI001179FA38|nr:hypothetical protein [Kibdelosporangium aridum]
MGGQHRAGLLPALSAGALPVTGLAEWPQVVFSPTARPMRELAAVLPAGGPAVVVVDQFEETFTLCTDPAEACPTRKQRRPATVQ